MSDDPRVYRTWGAVDNKISDLIRKLEGMGYGEDAKKLHNQYAPEKLAMKEGKKEDVDGDGDIDSKDYLAKRDAAIKKAKGEMKEDIDLGHEDNEPHMIKAELYRIGKYAMELYAMAEELEETGQEIDFPAWWQSMITDAATKMVKAKHYLDFELKEPYVDAFVDKITGEKPHEGEPRIPMADLDEGFLDRVAAKVKGATSFASTGLGNLGRSFMGKSLQDPKYAAGIAKLGVKAKGLEKKLNDTLNDVEKLFTPDQLSQTPALAQIVTAYKTALKDATQKTVDIASGKMTAGNSNSPSTSKEEPKEEPKTEPAGKARDEKGRFTSTKTTTTKSTTAPKTEPISDKYEVTNDTYTFNGKDFAVQVDKNTKEKFFKNDDGRVMDISTLEKSNQFKKKSSKVAENLAKQLKAS
jgi:hypothetical protein